MSINSKDLYKRLEVSKNASQKDIKNAYYKLVKKYPPQKDKDNFKLLQEAYNTLYNPISRNEYDAEINFGEELKELQSILDQAESDENISKRIRTLKKMILINKKSGLLKNKLGNAFLDNEDYKNAIEQFSKALEIDSENYEYNLNLGYALQYSGKNTKAINQFNRAKELDEDSSAPFNAIANLLYDSGKKTAAYKELKEGIEADGELNFLDFELIFTRMKFYILDDKKAKLKQDLKLVKEISNDKSEKEYAGYMITTFAGMLVGFGRYKSAYEMTKVAYKLMPSDDWIKGTFEVSKDAYKLRQSSRSEPLKLIVSDCLSIYFGTDGIWAGSTGSDEGDWDAKVSFIQNVLDADPESRKLINGCKKIKREFKSIYNIHPKLFDIISDSPAASGYSGDCPGIGCDRRCVVDKYQSGPNDVYSCDSCGIQYTWDNMVSRFRTYEGGGCFIATAVYENKLHTNVSYLREFRDKNLFKFYLGRKFIKFYYKYGSVFAEKIKNKKTIKTMIKKFIIEPIVYILKLFFNPKK